jgi:plasmid maintenance system killer protein
MRIEFADRQLQRCYEDQALAVRRWGMDVANRFADRILTIQDARSWQALASIRTLRLHPLTGRRSGQWAMRLNSRWRLIVRPVGDDLADATMILIEEVSNHYGD